MAETQCQNCFLYRPKENNIFSAHSYSYGYRATYVCMFHSIYILCIIKKKLIQCFEKIEIADDPLNYKEICTGRRVLTPAMMCFPHLSFLS